MSKKRVFVSFAMEDRITKIMFTGQAKNASVPYEFVDMSVKEPWDSAWKTNCRTRIKGCDGVIVLVSKNTARADGALWEIKCAKEEGIPIMGIYIDGASAVHKPLAMNGTVCKEWTWDNVKGYIDNL